MKYIYIISGQVQKLISSMMIFAVRAYQVVLRPLLPQTCRFYPTCSAYAIEAIKKHGPFKGGFLSVYRILRCNPFNHGGYDPVPVKVYLKK